MQLILSAWVTFQGKFQGALCCSTCQLIAVIVKVPSIHILDSQNDEKSWYLGATEEFENDSMGVLCSWLFTFGKLLMVSMASLIA